MREFFKPWRRKVGVVTLVIACVFTVGWVRSFHLIDQVRYGNPIRTPLLLMQNGPPGRFILDYCNMGPISTNFKFQWSSFPTTQPLSYLEAQTGVLGRIFYRWVDDPDEVAKDGYPEYSRFGFALHHRTVVIPLLLLCAWLLLSKPRPTKNSGPALPPEPDHA